MADRKEAARLWQEILDLERVPAANAADFAWKQKEMASLRQAYMKATGTSCSPSNWRENELKGDLKAFRGIGGRETEHPTSEDLNNLPKGYEQDRRPGYSGGGRS